ncbi:MAG: hypothetical protein AAFO94_04030 [Bacteroidota bacterium]
MKQLAFVLLLSSMMMACATYDKEALVGHWKNENWEMIFNEDGSMKMGKDGQYLEGEFGWRPFGNTLEITRNGKVFLSNLTVKSVENNELTLEFRNLVGNTGIQMENLQVLKRVE